MAVYPSDGDIYAGWKSFGRSFALFGVLALAVAATGRYFAYGHDASRLPASDQMLAFAAMWIGGALATLMGIAALGSIQISLSERGSVEVTTEGVRRMVKPGHEEFFPRNQIAALVARPQGGVVLLDSTSTPRMIIPRSIEGYRDCIAELKAMGIQSLPATRQNLGWASRKLTRAEWFYLFLACAIGNFYADDRVHGFAHHGSGLVLAALILLGVIYEHRKTRQRKWANWIFAAVALIAIACRW